ncbi:MAG: DUF4124 domain-containing protein [Cellvibrionales bacterium]|nr:DUF4124 domain-containing protein [Cellvibrionales bacterium]
MTTLLLFLGLLLCCYWRFDVAGGDVSCGNWLGHFLFYFPAPAVCFVFKYWDESRSAIVTQTIGLLLLLAAVFTGGDAFTKEYKSQFNRYLKQAAPEQMQEWKELQSMMSGPDMVPIPKPTVSKKTTVTQTETTDASGEPNAGEAGEVDEAVKTIYQCVDKNGNVSFIDKPCTGKQEKVITIRDIDEPSLEKSVDGLLDKVKQAVAPVTAPDSGEAPR